MIKQGRDIMRRLKVGVSLYIIALITITLGFYIYNLERQKNILLSELEKGVELIESILPADYHDRVLRGEEVSPEEHELLTKQLTLYAHSEGMKYVYTMVATPQRLAYSTSSVPLRQLKDGDYGIFLETIVPEDDSIYSIKSRILQGKEEEFTGRYSDKWGEYSALIVGKYTSEGRRYLIGAEYDLNEYRKTVLLETFKILLIDLLFMILALPLIHLIFQEFKREKQLIKEEGMRDELTGLYTRKALEMVEERITSKKPTQWAAFYFDLDGLKKVNDSKGHRAGDRYITDFTEILQSTFRGEDFLLRVGGDEFLVVVNLIHEGNLSEVWGRLLERSRNSDVSFSTGVELFKTSEFQCLDEIIRITDHKMYLEKKRKYQKEVSHKG